MTVLIEFSIWINLLSQLPPLTVTLWERKATVKSHDFTAWKPSNRMLCLSRVSNHDYNSLNFQFELFCYLHYLHWQSLHEKRKHTVRSHEFTTWKPSNHMLWLTRASNHDYSSLNKFELIYNDSNLLGEESTKWSQMVSYLRTLKWHAVTVKCD